MKCTAGFELSRPPQRITRLHFIFDVQVFTRDGMDLVNPYAHHYLRLWCLLLRGRGTRELDRAGKTSHERARPGSASAVARIRTVTPQAMEW